MIKQILFVWLALFITMAAHAGDECQSLKGGEIRLLEGTTFDLHYTGLLNGCFTGFLPPDNTTDDGLFRFSIFKNGKRVTDLPVVEAGMDLSSNPKQHLKVVAVSFADLNNDAVRDVAVVGTNLSAGGERTFVQVFWGCNSKFVFDEKANSDINWDLGQKANLSLKEVQQYISKRGFRAKCG